MFLFFNGYALLILCFLNKRPLKIMFFNFEAKCFCSRCFCSFCLFVDFNFCFSQVIFYLEENSMLLQLCVEKSDYIKCFFIGKIHWIRLIFSFYNFRKKSPRSKWTIYKHKSVKKQKCLVGGNFRILSVIVCHLEHVQSLHQLIQRPELFTKSIVYHLSLSWRGRFFFFYF